MLLIQFAALQLLDALTTLWCMYHGAAEANPLLRWAFAFFGQPAAALAMAKTLSVAAAFWAWRTGRHRVLRKANFLFVGCVAWNLVAVGLTSGGGLTG